MINSSAQTPPTIPGSIGGHGESPRPVPRVFFALGVIAAIIFAALTPLAASDVLPYKEGRTNGAVPSFPLFLLIAVVVLASCLLFAVGLIGCLVRRGWSRASILFVLFLLAWIPSALTTRQGGYIADFQGFSDWAATVNTAPVVTWLAAKPTGPPPPPSSWLLHLASGKSKLGSSVFVPVSSVPRFDSGRLPEEVYVLPGSGSILAVYFGSASVHLVAIGPAASSVPSQLSEAIEWKTVRPDLVIGVYSRP